jgi:hypothetical protein
MVTAKQTRTARTSVKNTRHAVASKKTIAHKPTKSKTAVSKRGTVMTQRSRSVPGTARTRAELYEIAKRKDLPGRSRMGRDELARKLGVR